MISKKDRLAAQFGIHLSIKLDQKKFYQIPRQVGVSHMEKLGTHKKRRRRQNLSTVLRCPPELPCDHYSG